MKSEKLEIVLVYRGADGSAVQLARVNDEALAGDVAEAAIEEAELRARTAAGNNEAVALVHRLEARRLRDLLAALVPSLYPIRQNSQRLARVQLN